MWYLTQEVEVRHPREHCEQKNGQKRDWVVFGCMYVISAKAVLSRRCTMACEDPA